MRRVGIWIMACALGVGVAVLSPGKSAADPTVQGEQARAAVEVALAYADRRGMTYATGGVIRQRIRESRKPSAAPTASPPA